MKSQDNKIKYDGLSGTRQNRNHYIHNYNDNINTNYKIYVI